MRKWLFVIGLAFIVSCSSIDCPVNNVVATRYRFYNTDGDSLILMDTLSVTSVRKDGTDRFNFKLINFACRAVVKSVNYTFAAGANPVTDYGR